MVASVTLFSLSARYSSSARSGAIGSKLMVDPREPRKTPPAQMPEIGRLTPERSIRSTRERKPAAPTLLRGTDVTSERVSVKDLNPKRRSCERSEQTVSARFTILQRPSPETGRRRRDLKITQRTIVRMSNEMKLQQVLFPLLSDDSN